MLRLITDFTRVVERQGEGIPGRDGLLHQIKQPQDDFRVAVRKTAPCFVPQFRKRPVSEVTGPSLSSASEVFMSESAASVSPKPVSIVSAPAPYTYPPFLVGGEDSDEIGLNDGEKIFIDDVLETAEWCVSWLCGVNLTHNKPSYQGSHTGATKQLSFHGPEGVHYYLC